MNNLQKRAITPAQVNNTVKKTTTYLGVTSDDQGSMLEMSSVEKLDVASVNSHSFATET